MRLRNLKMSPVPLKYLGSRTSEKVKNKILELLYSWTVGLPEEVKIAEAYQMLKKQGEAPRGGHDQHFPPSSDPRSFRGSGPAGSGICL